MVQLEFEISDEARALPVPNGHASSFEGGTILECLTHFAILRLQDKGYVVRTGKNLFTHSGKKYLEHIPRQEVEECLVSFKILHGRPMEEICTLLQSKWDADTVLAARAKWELTTVKEENKVGI